MFPPHDHVIILGDFSAVSCVHRQGYADVIGNYGLGTVNDNSLWLLSYCSAYQLSILGSWYCRRNAHCFTWYCNDGQTHKEIDYIRSSKRELFRWVYVYHDAEPFANSDHCLLPEYYPDITHMDCQSSMLSECWTLDHWWKIRPSRLSIMLNSVEFSDTFTALGKLSQNVEHAWKQVRDTEYKWLKAV